MNDAKTIGLKSWVLYELRANWTWLRALAEGLREWKMVRPGCGALAGWEGGWRYGR